MVQLLYNIKKQLKMAHTQQQKKFLNDFCSNILNDSISGETFKLNNFNNDIINFMIKMNLN